VVVCTLEMEVSTCVLVTWSGTTVEVLVRVS
jgi:hypothetical protein